MRDYRGTTLELERVPEARFLEDRWRWHVRIPAWMRSGGMKASGVPATGSSLTRRGALKAAKRAVERQMAIDAAERELLRWESLGHEWL